MIVKPNVRADMSRAINNTDLATIKAFKIKNCKKLFTKPYYVFVNGKH